jgi:hypothetical protein
MRRVDWRRLLLVFLLCSIWWAFTLARGCDGGGPRPLELVPAEQRGGGK